MESVVNKLLSDMTDSASQSKSIYNCIDDGEFSAARKLLKRHQMCIEGTAKKIKETMVSMTDIMRNQRLSIANTKHQMIKKEMGYVKNKRSVEYDAGRGETSSKTQEKSFEDVDNDETGSCSGSGRRIR